MFKFQPGGDPILHAVSSAQRGFESVSLTLLFLWGSIQQNNLLYWQHLTLILTILSNFWGGLIYDSKPLLGIIVYWHCYQLFLHWRLKFLIKLSYLIFLSFVHSRFKFKALITKKQKYTGFSKLAHQVFSYKWDSVSHIIKNIYSIISFKESKCDLYTIEYISHSPIHCSKGNIKFVLKFTKFPEKPHGYMLKTNC